MRGRILSLIAVTASALAGCATPVQTGTVSASLSGTGWELVELVEFEASSDKTSVMRPKDPSQYQLILLPNGELAMKLDCNRGTGKWSYATSGYNQGSLTLSPVATTRAACEAGSLDSKIASDASRVRGYVLAGNRLSLSLEANAAVYTWERIQE